MIISGASGSDSESAPRRAPETICGSHRCFCSSVPYITMRVAHMLCVLTMPESDIQPYASSSTTPMYVRRSRPRPPYSSGIVTPKAEVPHRRHDVGGILVGVLEIVRDRDDVARDELAHRRDHLLPQLRVGRRCNGHFERIETPAVPGAP
jgi:hypothetical protein